MERKQIGSEDEEAIMASHIATASVLPMVLKSAIDLGLLDIIADVGPAGSLSAAEIAAKLPTTSAAAATTAGAKVDRILRLLACNSVVECFPADLPGGGGVECRYRVGRLTKFFTNNDGGVSFASLCLMAHDKTQMDSWYHLNDAILNNESPFEKARGMSSYKYHGTDSRFNKVFNKAMYDGSAITTKKLLETYKGFEGLNSIVDVGGGTGAVLSMIVAKYPSIKGINFDLPHVINTIVPSPGVEHVGGDMFVSVPKGDAIFIKSVCHNWSDEQCLKLLKNCYNALPENGKVIVVECILPPPTDTSAAATRVVLIDVAMLLQMLGGKERSAEEFEALAKAVGFKQFKIVCDVVYCHVMEFLND